MADNYVCPYCKEKGDYFHFYWKEGEMAVLIDDEECFPSIYCCPSCSMVWNDLDKEEMKNFIKNAPSEEKRWFDFLKDLDK